MHLLPTSSAASEVLVFFEDVVIVDGRHSRQQFLLEAVVFWDVRPVNDFLGCAREER